jgi:hypothetical protein
MKKFALFALVLCTALSAAGAGEFPGDDWTRATPAEVGMDAAELETARDYALTTEGAGYITRHGKLVMSWGPIDQTYDLKSSSKSIGVMAIGLAMLDGTMALDDKAVKYQPELGTHESAPEVSKFNRDTGWLDQITLFHLATQTAGFEKPGGYGKLLFEPGTKWLYSDAGPNWLAECVTKVYKQDIETLMFDRVFTPIGIEREDLRWRKHSYRPALLDGIPSREFGSGVHANVDAMARIGYLHLRRGVWNGKRILPEAFIDLARQPHPKVASVPLMDGEWSHDNASTHYGLLWWNNGDGTLANVPRDAYWSWGLYDSLIVVIPSLDIVASRTGKSWKRTEGAQHYAVLEPFLGNIVASVRDAEPQAPYPPSAWKLDWSPVDTIRRDASGSDNFPMTWADDDLQYSAYGDGWGFEPKVEKKLSIGLVTVEGGPENFVGRNLRTPDMEFTGQGEHGPKASGILMVEGVLYLFARNLDNARLSWSEDHGRTWTHADWRFTESFGAPTFLNFGKNYAGARDNHVYVYSFDSDSAYIAADRMVMARVPKDRIRELEAYEYFVRLDPQGEPVWSSKLADRGAIFEHPGRCYRSGITYNPALKRYIWSQILPESEHEQGMRFQGGFGVYEAPEPWGPWRTVYFANNWDVGPGETSSFPTKWMSDDGKTMWLVFSGDDHFSVRKATVSSR